jgi:hypothetical protein
MDLNCMKCENVVQVTEQWLLWILSWSFEFRNNEQELSETLSASQEDLIEYRLNYKLFSSPPPLYFCFFLLFYFSSPSFPFVLFLPLLVCILFRCEQQPKSALWRLTVYVSRSRKITHTHTHTHSRIPLDEWSARRRGQIQGFLCEHFITRYVFTVRICQHLAQPPKNWRITPCRLSATAYLIHSQLPSISEAVPRSATWGRAMPWWQGPTYRGILGLVREWWGSAVRECRSYLSILSRF